MFLQHLRISLQHLDIPESYTRTEKSERFLLYDSGVESGSQRIVLFGTEANVELLSTAAVWLADFKTVPSLFYQLYICHTCFERRSKYISHWPSFAKFVRFVTEQDPRNICKNVGKGT